MTSFRLTIASAALGLPILVLAHNHQAAPPVTSARYLYVIGCGATVDKLDTQTERKLSHTELSNQSDLVPNPKGHLDGCLANGVVFLKSHHVFYTAVPTSAQLDAHGAQQYRLLSFSLPEMKFNRAVALAGLELSNPPELGINAEQAIDVMAGGKNFELMSGADLKPEPTVSPDFAKELDLSGYAGGDLSPYRVRQGAASETLPAQVIDRSGSVALVQLTSAGSSNIFAVANQRTKRVTIFQNLPPTFPQNVHLAPEGAAVLVEAAKSAPDGAELTQKTGQLVLLDGISGKRLKEWTVPNLGAYQFLAITPNGKIAYHLGSRYRFIDSIGATYSNEPVYRQESIGPALFFASE